MKYEEHRKHEFLKIKSQIISLLWFIWKGVHTKTQHTSPISQLLARAMTNFSEHSALQCPPRLWHRVSDDDTERSAFEKNYYVV